MARQPAHPRGPDAVTHQLPAGELPAGWKLLGGQYEIVRLIASGGFGITYLARDTLGRDVAVKECFPLGLARRAAMTHTVSATSAGTSEHFETARAQFLREARMLAGLRHPNVVHVQTLFEENGTAYMAMDFIHGRDLHEEIIAETLTPTRVLDLARDLLGALAYVHGQGVLHRDIKPQNIRVDSFGVPMLIDFGAARAETQARSRMAGTFRVVTDGYSPHEFYVTGAKQGPHSDLYALAATLHHIVTGAAPIAADERASAMATGQPDPYVPIAGAHPGQDARLLHLIDRALRMTPADRPADASAWLTALTDAPTTLVAASVTPPARLRLWPGVALGVLLMGGVGAGIWTAQPDWLSPGMDEMDVQISTLETRLAETAADRAATAASLAELEVSLAASEAELQRLEDMDGDMATTLADLDAARTARDAAAAQVIDLQTDLDALTAAAEATQGQLLAEETRASTLAQQAEASRAELAAEERRAAELAQEAQAARTRTAEAEAEASALAAQIAPLEASNTAAQSRIAELETSLAEARALSAQITELEASEASARARVTALEASLADATGQLIEARTTAALLTRAEADLGDAQAALNAATVRAATLDAQLEQARTRAEDLEDVEAALAAAEAALARTEAARAQLAEDFATLEAAPLPNLGELAELRSQVAAAEAEAEGLSARITELENDNEALRAEVEAAQTALATAIAGRIEWTPLSSLRAPNGTFALLPRFSWDNRRIAAVDSTGGIALFERETGDYEGHLARGIPDRVRRLGFSAGGSYLIATTPDGAPNRLYDVAARREILRFDPVTVTTANRAISSDEQFFVFTRAASGAQVDIVITSLPALSSPDAQAEERTLTTVPEGTAVRIAFSESRNEINVLTPSGIRIFAPDGRLLQTTSNRIGPVAALSPIGGDQGVLVLRRDGEVMIYDDLISQQVVATVAPRADYSLYRLSGDRLSFLRANDETWEVIDLLTGDIRGAGVIEEDPQQANISISAEGTMIFIGATLMRPARLLDVATGVELQGFEDATQGYFSFDNTHLATGRADGSAAQIWRVAGSEVQGCAPLDRAMDGIPILPNALERGRIFAVQAGGDVPLSPCAAVQDPALSMALRATGQTGLSVSQAPDVAINILGTARDYRLDIMAEGECAPTVVARFADEWSASAPGTPLALRDDGARTRPLDVWLATPEGEACNARIVLSGGEDP